MTADDAPPGGQAPLDVVVRATEVDDAAALARLHAHESVVWGTMQLPHPAVRSWRERLDNPPPGMRTLVAVASDGSVVGALALSVEQRPRRSHVATVGMSVAHEVQGRGVGARLLGAALDLADCWLQVTRVELGVYPDNEPAVRLYRRFGFEEEGRARKAVFRDGAYVDLLHMARLHPRLTD